MTKRKIEYWVIPPEADGEFVANMEDVPNHHNQLSPLPLRRYSDASKRSYVYSMSEVTQS